MVVLIVHIVFTVVVLLFLVVLVLLVISVIIFGRNYLYVARGLVFQEAKIDAARYPKNATRSCSFFWYPRPGGSVA